MPNPELVEPSGQVVKEEQLPTNSAAQQASASPDGQSASASLKDALSKLSPAKEEPTNAQKLSEEAPEAEPAPKKEPVAPTKPADAGEPEKPETSSALEGFRTDHQKARAKKQKAASEPLADEQPTDETKPVGDAPKNDDDPPVTEEEIQQELKNPALSKRHQKRMVFLANEAKELRVKLATAEAKPQSNANDEKIKELTQKQEQANKELVQYRRRYSLESEPELKKFDEVATKADEAIYGKLKEAGLSDKTLELIKSSGGFEGFSRSNQVFTINVKNADGDVVPTPIPASQLARQWLNDMNVPDAEYIKAKLGERFNAIDGKKRRTDELAAGADTWFKEQQAQYQQQVQQSQQVAEQYRSGYDKKTTEWLASQELLKDRSVPANASEDERKEIEDYNKHNAGVRNLVKMAVAPTSLDDHVAIVQEAAKSLLHARENRSLKQELATTKAKLEKIQKGLTTTGKPGGSSIQTAPKKKEEGTAATLAVTAADSLREGMERLRQGQGDE